MFCTKCGQENEDDANFCKKCGNQLEPLDDNVSEKNGINENPKPVKDTVLEQKGLNENSETIDEILKNIEIEAIVIGSIVTIVMIFMFEYIKYYPVGLRVLSVITGSAIAGYLSKNSTKYSLIYGVIIGVISTLIFTKPLFFLASPVIIIMGLIGGYLGKYIHDNYV